MIFVLKQFINNYALQCRRDPLNTSAVFMMGLGDSQLQGGMSAFDEGHGSV